MLPRFLDHLIWADDRIADSLATLAVPDAEFLKLYDESLATDFIPFVRGD